MPRFTAPLASNQLTSRAFLDVPDERSATRKQSTLTEFFQEYGIAVIRQVDMTRTALHGAISPNAVSGQVPNTQAFGHATGQT